MSNQDFWNKRVCKYGHTGWSDAVIYAYDQIARIKAIKEIIKTIEVKTGLALDFGTGSGDFTPILAEKFKKVFAFDISENVIKVAKNRYGYIPNVEFIHGNSVLDLEIGNNSLDLILSITVIGFILDDNELIQILNWFKNKICKNGFIIALEYVPKNKPKIISTYQRFSTFDEWISIFYKCGFKLQKYYEFYHPTECPCKSYQLYRQSIKVKFLKYFRNCAWAKKCLDSCAKSILQNYTDFFWEGQKETPSKIMIFKKSI